MPKKFRSNFEYLADDHTKSLSEDRLIVWSGITDFTQTLDLIIRQRQNLTIMVERLSAVSKYDDKKLSLISL